MLHGLHLLSWSCFKWRSCTIFRRVGRLRLTAMNIPKAEETSRVHLFGIWVHCLWCFPLKILIFCLRKLQNYRQFYKWFLSKNQQLLPFLRESMQWWRLFLAVKDFSSRFFQADIFKKARRWRFGPLTKSESIGLGALVESKSCS